VLLLACSVSPAAASPDPLRVHAAELDLALHVLQKLRPDDALSFARDHVNALTSIKPGTADAATRTLLLDRAERLLQTPAAKRLDPSARQEATKAMAALTTGLPAEIVARWNLLSAPKLVKEYRRGLAAELLSKIGSAGDGAAALAKLRLADPWWREPWALSAETGGKTDYAKLRAEIESRIALLQALAKQVDLGTIGDFQETLEVAARLAATKRGTRAAIALWEVQKMAVALHAAHPKVHFSETFGDAGLAQFGLRVARGRVRFDPQLPKRRALIDMTELIQEDATVRVFAADGVTFDLPTAKSMGLQAGYILPREPIVVSFASAPSLAIVVVWPAGGGARRTLWVPRELPKNYVFITDRDDDVVGLLIDRRDLPRGVLARLIETSLKGEDVAASQPALRMFAKLTDADVKTLSKSAARKRARAAQQNSDAKVEMKRTEAKQLREAIVDPWLPIGGLVLPPSLSSLGYEDWHTNAIEGFSTNFVTTGRPSGKGPWTLRRFHTAKE